MAVAVSSTLKKRNSTYHLNKRCVAQVRECEPPMLIKGPTHDPPPLFTLVYCVTIQLTFLQCGSSLTVCEIKIYLW